MHKLLPTSGLSGLKLLQVTLGFEKGLHHVRHSLRVRTGLLLLLLLLLLDVACMHAVRYALQAKALRHLYGTAAAA
jgi:hypothetical protein